jgi:predicted nucleic acid-binding Zn ribbon protein
MFKQLKDILPTSLKRYGIVREAQAAFVCTMFEKIVKEELGEEASKNCRSLSFKNGVLKIQVSDSAWASEIQLNQSKIIDKINKKVGKKVVDRLQFRVK